MIAVTEHVALEPADVVRAGDAAEAFPDVFLERTAFERALTFPTGRAALWYALEDAGLGPTDEVLIPSFTDLSVKRAVERVARPVPVDVEPGGYNIDLDDAEERVADRTAAIVPTHLWGEPIDMEAVAAFAAEHGLLVIEDGAHALGTTYTSDLVGRYSDYCLFSFRFTKEVTAYKGGLLLLPDGSTPSRSRREKGDRLSLAKLGGIMALSGVLESMPGRLYHPLRNRVLNPYFRTSAGRVTDVELRQLSARERSLLAEQYERLDDRVRIRRRHASRYDEMLDETLGRPPSNPDHGYFRYSLRVPASKRDSLYCALQRRGIGCSKSYSYTVSSSGECPEADRAADRVLNLPVHAGLDDEDAERIVDVVNAAWVEVA